MEETLFWKASMRHSRIHKAGIAHPLNFPYEMSSYSYHLPSSQGVQAFLRQILSLSVTQESLQLTVSGTSHISTSPLHVGAVL